MTNYILKVFKRNYALRTTPEGHRAEGIGEFIAVDVCDGTSREILESIGGEWGHDKSALFRDLNTAEIELQKLVMQLIKDTLTHKPHKLLSNTDTIGFICPADSCSYSKFNARGTKNNYKDYALFPEEQRKIHDITRNAIDYRFRIEEELEKGAPKAEEASNTQ